MSKIQESSGVSFSLSYLIQLVTAIAVGTWGFSQLDNRISFVENTSGTNATHIEAIVKSQQETQDQPISSDHVQNTSLKFIEEDLDRIDEELKILAEKIYELNRLISMRR